MLYWKSILFDTILSQYNLILILEGKHCSKFLIENAALSQNIWRKHRLC